MNNQIQLTTSTQIFIKLIGSYNALLFFDINKNPFICYNTFMFSIIIKADQSLKPRIEVHKINLNRVYNLNIVRMCIFDINNFSRKQREGDKFIEFHLSSTMLVKFDELRLESIDGKKHEI